MQQHDAPEFLPIEYELPREDSRRDHWRRRNRSQQQVSRVLMSKGVTLIAPHCVAITLWRGAGKSRVVALHHDA